MSHETLPLEHSGQANEVRRFRLTVLSGPDKGQTFTSSSDKVVLGTHSSSGWVLTDETISRFHCELVADGTHVVLRDLQSRNGTLVSGVRVLHAHLHDGAVLSIGRSEIRFDSKPETVRLPVSSAEHFGRLIGKSVAMRRAFSVLERAAATDASVLIHGETGTGKEVTAESIHQQSARKGKPFVVVDCGAIPPNLLEAELFGHEKGAFTGAITAREGAFAAADGGTVFLDEIGELAPDLQPKLLRVLESRHVKAVGATKFRDVDVRILAATNRDLREEVNQKRFRSDLYFRLAVLEVKLPSLRERPDDIPVMVEHLLEKLGASAENIKSMLTYESLNDLCRHAWPGNVRELRNYLERCLAMSERVPLSAQGTEEDLAKLPDCGKPLKDAREQWTRTMEKAYVAEMLSRHGGNVAQAARAAEVDRMHFYRLLWRHGLK